MLFFALLLCFKEELTDKKENRTSRINTFLKQSYIVIQRLDVGCQRSEVRSEKSEVGYGRSDARGHKSDVRG